MRTRSVWPLATSCAGLLGSLLLAPPTHSQLVAPETPRTLGRRRHGQEHRTAMKSRVVVLLAFTVMALPALSAPPQEPKEQSTTEIPLERCDRLPVVVVRMDGAAKRLLLDTGSTSMLNLQSFPKGDARRVEITSWNGTTGKSAREILVHELVLGPYRAQDLKLVAVDLSALTLACGSSIDGILGIDLLESMGATLDLKRRVATLPADNAAEANRYRAYQTRCLDALNRADARALQDCLDPEVVLVTPAGEVRGRKAVVDYVRATYWSTNPPAHFERQEREVRFLGELALANFIYRIERPQGLLELRSTGLCRRTGDRWRMISLHSSVVSPPPLAPER